MRYKEDITQIAIANYIRFKGFLFTSTNGGVYVKSIPMRNRLKQMGNLAGASDIIVWIPGGTLCIEVKRPKTMEYSFKSKKMILNDSGGRQSEAQKDFESRVTNIPGHHYIIATDVEQVAKYIEENGIKPF